VNAVNAVNAVPGLSSWGAVNATTSVTLDGTAGARSFVPARVRTMYFIGVSTGRSSVRSVFPRWAAALGLADATLVGIDLPVHADPSHYRQVTDFIADDPLSLGALITTHKIDLYAAASDRFDVVDPLAELMGEVSCLSKRDGALIAHAKDPISSGHALDAFLPPGYWRDRPAAAACLIGAGGSAIAISWYLSRPERGTDRPGQLVITNRSRARLEHVQSVHERLATEVPIRYELAPSRADNDAIVRDLAAGSLEVNATGLGKDAPGSPISPGARFPERGIAWDLNYRGELVFLDQARSAVAAQRLQVEDGWIYFVHGWIQAIAEVFDIEIATAGAAFEDLATIAAGCR
jgi:shikimate 5-dehydrogenase